MNGLDRREVADLHLAGLVVEVIRPEMDVAAHCHAGFVAARREPVLRFLRAGTIADHGDAVVDLPCPLPFDCRGEVAVADRVGLRHSLHDVQQADVGELAEDGGEDRAEPPALHLRLFDRIDRRGSPQILTKAEFGRGDRRSVVHQCLPRHHQVPSPAPLYGRGIFTFRDPENFPGSDAEFRARRRAARRPPFDTAALVGELCLEAQPFGVQGRMISVSALVPSSNLPRT